MSQDDAHDSPCCGPSQRVTAADRQDGRVRVPPPTKRCLPSVSGDISVVLRGEALGACHWDPRLGPDRPRSGRISVGRDALRRHVRDDEILTICVDRSGTVYLD